MEPARLGVSSLGPSKDLAKDHPAGRPRPGLLWVTSSLPGGTPLAPLQAHTHGVCGRTSQGSLEKQNEWGVERSIQERTCRRNWLMRLWKLGSPPTGK